MSADVSVVVTSYNAASYLAEALESVCRQSLPPREVIVVDDGSSDGSVRVAESFRARLPLEVVALPENGGKVVAQNLGVRRASSSWVAILECDDVWFPSKLEEQVRFIEQWHEDAIPLVAVGCRGRHINAGGRDVGGFDFGLHRLEDYEATRRAGDALVIPHSGAMFRRDLFHLVGGYDDSYVGVDDVELWTRMAEHGAVVNIDRDLIFFRKHPASASHRQFRASYLSERRLDENVRRRQAAEPELSVEEHARTMRAAPLSQRARDRKNELSSYAYKTGASIAVNGSPLRGGAYLAVALVLRPRKVISGLRRR